VQTEYVPTIAETMPICLKRRLGAAKSISTRSGDTTANRSDPVGILYPHSHPAKNREEATRIAEIFLEAIFPRIDRKILQSNLDVPVHRRQARVEKQSNNTQKRPKNGNNPDLNADPPSIYYS
jgi:hypothetical protein